MNLPIAHNSEVIAHTSLNATPTLFRLAFTPEAEIDTLSQWNWIRVSDYHLFAKSQLLNPQVGGVKAGA